ncbi:MAG: molybdopterin-dependent oxidoreductase, partial [Hyphomicrobiales bacterium]|nr:molybdopterin-dependent oxidoreductase [Hyphomicrobiales bacterium]
MTLVERASVCTLDCPDTCSLTVTVEDGRLVKVRGSKALPYTEGVICTKVAHHSEAFVHGPGRLTHPLRRTGERGSGKFARVSWDEALDLVHTRVAAVIDRYGPQAVMPLNYAGPHGILSYDSMSLRFFHKLGATQLFRGALCGAVRSEAWFGTYGSAPGIGPEAAGEAALNVIGGTNARSRIFISCARRARPNARAESSRWSIRCARKSPPRRICISRRCPAPTSCSASRSPSNLSGLARMTATSSPRTCSATTNTWRRRARGRRDRSLWPAGGDAAQLRR